MKIRSVRPEFFTDIKMSELSPWARLLYVGLWGYVDDEGRGQYLPKLIEGAIFPHDDVSIGDLLSELESAGRIVQYEVEGQQYFHIPKFGDHQKPNRKWDSKLPAPPTQDAPREPAQDTQRERSAQASLVVVDGDVDGRGDVVIGASADSRNVEWDTLVEIYGEPTPPQQSLYGRISKWIRGQEATPNEIRDRAERIVEKWGPQANTVTALEKHWNFLDSPAGRMSESDVEDYRRQMQRNRQLAEAERIDRGLNA